MKKVFLSCLFCCLFSLLSYPDTIHLKNGVQIDGEIIEENQEYVKIKFNGIGLTYWMEDIFTVSKEDANAEAEGYQYILSDVFDENTAKISVSDFQKQGKSFLWKIESQTSTVYLLGSIHLGRPDFYPLSKAIEEAFSKSNFLAVEANISALDTSVLGSIMTEAIYVDGSTLKSHLSSKTVKLVKQKMDELGMDIEQMIVFKPWFLALNLEMLGYVRLGLDPTYGIDIYFLNKAKNSKQIIELESVQFQINLLSSFNDKEQEAFLLSTLIDLDIVRDRIDKMINLWQTGNALGMEQVFMENIKADPGLFSVYNKLLFKRNKGMVSKINKFLNGRGVYFVVVGAGHLIGEEGIIKILENKGYTVEQL